MKPAIKRPIGITLFALPIIWIGCFGTLAFPIFIVTDAVNQAWELMTSSFIHSHTLSLIGACLFGVVWYGGYILYAFMGIGLWRMRLWAWKVAVGVQWFGIVMGLVVAIVWLFFKQWAMSIGIGVWCSGIFALILWYLKLPRTRWAFEANKAAMQGLPIPDPPVPPTRKVVGIQIGIAVVAFAAVMAIFVVSLSFTIEKTFRSSGAFAAAMSNAQASPCVVAKLGKPIIAKGSISGSVSEGNQTGEASLDIPVQGPKSTGTLHVDAVKADGNWTFKSLTLFDGDGQLQILPAPSPCL